MPSKVLSGSPSTTSVSIANIVKGLAGVLIFSGYKNVIQLINIYLVLKGYCN